MTDEQKALAAELDQLADRARQLADGVRRLADGVRQLGRAGDVIDDLREGGLLTVSQAAIACETTDQTIYRWLADAARRGRPLGLKRASTWLIGKARLLDYVERHQGGLPARVKAENRLKEYWSIWSRAPELRPDVNERAAG
jgi:X-X-X-Leu-X-X-Gly heptad repeat protein